MKKNNRSVKKKRAKTAPVKKQSATTAVALIEKPNVAIISAQSPVLSMPEPEVDFSNSFVLTEKGNLFPVKLESFYYGSRPVKDRFKNSEEMMDLIFQNRQTLFGKDSVLINEKKEKHLEWLGVFNFDAILFDFENIASPKLYLAIITLPNENYVNLFFRITDYFAFFSRTDAVKMLVEALSTALEEKEEVKKQLQEKIGESGIAEFIGAMVRNKPNVLLIMENYWQDLPIFKGTYSETWGESVKGMVLQKFARNGDALVAIAPSFETMRNMKKKKSDKLQRTTEQAHLETVSANVKEIYGKIKAELFKVDNSLFFNVQQNYISLKKGKNLAYFHLRKQSIYLVVMCPEKEVRKIVKHYVIKTLPPSVQKFWNGASTGLVIGEPTKIVEIINLLEKLIKEQL